MHFRSASLMNSWFIWWVSNCILHYFQVESVLFLSVFVVLLECLLTSQNLFQWWQSIQIDHPATIYIIQERTLPSFFLSSHRVCSLYRNETNFDQLCLFRLVFIFLRFHTIWTQFHGISAVPSAQLEISIYVIYGSCTAKAHIFLASVTEQWYVNTLCFFAMRTFLLIVFAITTQL